MFNFHADIAVPFFFFKYFFSHILNLSTFFFFELFFESNGNFVLHKLSKFEQRLGATISFINIIYSLHVRVMKIIINTCFS